MERHALPASTPLYRFVSMFELFDLVSRKRLRLAKFSTFEDKNEGVGAIIKMQDISIFRQKFIERATIEQHHAMTRENHYATCWSTEPDKIAMWSLYSEDRNGIRVATTLQKLQDTLLQCHEANSWTKAVENPGSKERVTWNCSVAPVEYVDYFELRDKVRERYRVFNEFASEKAAKDRKYYDEGGAFYENYSVFQQESAVPDRDGIFLKDAAYAHEHEVRGIVYSGVRNDISLEDWRASPDPVKNLFDWAEPGALDPFLYADIPVDFIDSVCFDPRMPTHKRQVLEALFPAVADRLVESRAFGYAVSQDSFASDFYGNPE